MPSNAFNYFLLHCHKLVYVNAPDIAPWVGLARDAITGIAAGVASVVAVAGLHTWKRQLHGNTNYELARGLLRSAYKLREAIRWVRSPFMSSGEMAAAMKAAGLAQTPQNTADDQAEELAYQARWDKVVATQVEFAAEVLEAEALWGPLIREQSEKLGACTGELNWALNQWVSRGKRAITPDREQKIMDTIYDVQGVSSDFSHRLNAAFGGLEEIIRPHLRL